MKQPQETRRLDTSSANDIPREETNHRPPAIARDCRQIWRACGSKFRRRSPTAPSVVTSPFVWSLGGGLFITLVFYLLQALGMQSWNAPFDFFMDNWYLVSPLIVLFATQAGLFGAIHAKRHPDGATTLAASGGVSAGTMFACCLHNLVWLIPILGTTGIAAFFADYQTEVFLVSIAFSFLGTLVLLFTLRSHSASCHLTHS